MKSSFASTALKLASNTSWLFLERAISLGIGIFVGLYFVRYLGPHDYGIYSYALGLHGIFATVSRLGINPLVIDQTVQEPAKQASILGSAFILRGIGSVASILVVNAIAYGIMDDTLPRQISLIFSMALLFGPFETITHWFEAKVRMRPVAVSRSIVSIAMGLLRLALILLEGPLLWFAWLIPLESLLTAAIFLYAYHRHGLNAWKWRPDLKVIRRFLRDGMPLLISTLAVMTYMKIDQVMLGSMTSPEEVGIYSAAVKISEMFYFIPMALSGALFPYLIRFDKRGAPLFREAFQLACDAFAWIAIGIAALTTLFSSQIIAAAFGENYRPSADILVVHVWAGLFVFTETLRSKYFVIRRITQFQLRTTVSGAVMNVLLNLLLIPRYQGFGAAIATTISYGVAVVLSCFLSRETREVGGMLLKSLVSPLRIAETARGFRTVRSAVDAER